MRALAHPSTRAGRLAASGVEVIAGDVTDPAAVRSALEGVGVVYHLAGRLLVPRVPPGEYHRTHVEGTALLLALAKSQGIERFVHCSTTGVLGATGKSPAAEDAPMRPTNLYEATKAESENLVRDSWRGGFPAVVARPGLVYGPGDRHLLPFVRSVLRRWFRPIGRETVLLHPIYIDDLAEALIRCAERPEAIGECFHLAGPGPVALAELADAFARAGGISPPEGHIPLRIARLVASLGDLLPPRLGYLAPLTSTRLEFLVCSRVYDITKARRLLGFKAEVDLPTGAYRTIAWYREQGYIGQHAPFPRPHPVSCS